MLEQRPEYVYVAGEQYKLVLLRVTDYSLDGVPNEFTVLNEGDGVDPENDVFTLAYMLVRGRRKLPRICLN